MSFVVISGSRCKWCMKAIDLLSQHKLDYKVVHINEEPWVKDLMAKANLNTVPQVFRPDGELIGGYKALEVYLGINIDS